MSDFSQYGSPCEEWTRLKATLPPPPEQTQEELKKATNQWREDASRTAIESLSSKVTMHDHPISVRDGKTIEARSYISNSSDPAAKLPIYIHYHGGGFFFGTLGSEDALCARIAIDVPVVVVNVNYRHSPEFKYPTAWHASEDAFHWVHEDANAIGGDKQQIVIGGISAGGQLAAALAQILYHEQAPSRSSVVSQVLMIPCLVHEDCYDSQLRRMKNRSISSYIENQFAPILPVTRIRMFNGLLHVTAPNPEDRRLNPGKTRLEMKWSICLLRLSVFAIGPTER